MSNVDPGKALNIENFDTEKTAPLPRLQGKIEIEGFKDKEGFLSQRFVDGDYAMPPDMFAAVVRAGQKIKAYVQSQNIDILQYGFDLDGNGTLTDREAGAALAAAAMRTHDVEKSAAKGGGFSIISIMGTEFDLTAPLTERQKLIAKQVLGDNSAGSTTNTSSANADFIRTMIAANAKITD